MFRCLGVGSGQGSLGVLRPWGFKDSEMTEHLNWGCLEILEFFLLALYKLFYPIPSNASLASFNQPFPQSPSSTAGPESGHQSEASRLGGDELLPLLQGRAVALLDPNILLCRAFQCFRWHQTLRWWDRARDDYSSFGASSLSRLFHTAPGIVVTRPRESWSRGPGSCGHAAPGVVETRSDRCHFQ